MYYLRVIWIIFSNDVYTLKSHHERVWILKNKKAINAIS